LIIKTIWRASSGGKRWSILAEDAFRNRLKKKLNPDEIYLEDYLSKPIKAL
jgi:hypothetical protein